MSVNKYLPIILAVWIFIGLIIPSKALAQLPTDLIWTNPWTAYDPAADDTLQVSFLPGSEWQSPYFQQEGFTSSGYSYGINPYIWQAISYYVPPLNMGFISGYPYGGINWYLPLALSSYASRQLYPNSLFGIGAAYGGYNWYLPFGGISFW